MRGKDFHPVIDHVAKNPDKLGRDGDEGRLFSTTSMSQSWSFRRRPRQLRSGGLRASRQDRLTRFRLAAIYVGAVVAGQYSQLRFALYRPATRPRGAWHPLTAEPKRSRSPRRDFTTIVHSITVCPSSRARATKGTTMSKFYPTLKIPMKSDCLRRHYRLDLMYWKC